MNYSILSLQQHLYLPINLLSVAEQTCCIVNGSVHMLPLFIRTSCAASLKVSLTIDTQIASVVKKLRELYSSITTDILARVMTVLAQCILPRLFNWWTSLSSPNFGPLLMAETEIAPRALQICLQSLALIRLPCLSRVINSLLRPNYLSTCNVQEQEAKLSLG